MRKKDIRESYLSSFRFWWAINHVWGLIMKNILGTSSVTHELRMKSRLSHRVTYRLHDGCGRTTSRVLEWEMLRFEYASIINFMCRVDHKTIFNTSYLPPRNSERVATLAIVQPTVSTSLWMGRHLIQCSRVGDAVPWICLHDQPYTQRCISVH